MKQDIFNQYVDRIVNRFGIKRDELFSKSKKRELVDARHLLYYMCVKRPMRINYIQRYMSDNGYDIQHSSIIHGVNMTISKIQNDKDYVDLVHDMDNVSVA